MRFLDKSKENGWQVIRLILRDESDNNSFLCSQVVGAALEESSINLVDLDLSKPTILVLGNEGHGVRTNILKRCDALVKIRGREGAAGEATPTKLGTGGSMVDSLNVSVSGAILMHYILCNGGRPSP